MAKVDSKAAFRMVPVRRTCLSFGCRSSLFLFNKFAEALQWIITENYYIQAIHYLDDYFMVGPPDSPACSLAKEKTLFLCQSLGIPVAMEKVEGPASTITFLGIEIDSQLQELRLPANNYTSSYEN